MNIPSKDLKVEFFRATGNGGQNVNKVETAVRLTHLPTGITAMSQDERSQSQNRERAMKALIGRIAAKRFADRASLLGKMRQEQLTSGRVRTYNFHRNEVVDHRTGARTTRVYDVLDGDLDLLRA